MTSEAPELLPCPFCGGEAEWKIGGPGCAFISCKSCPAETGDGSIPRIRTAWNTRADLHQQAIAAAYKDAKDYLTGEASYAQWDRKQYPSEFLDWLKVLAEDIGDSCPKEATSALQQALEAAEAIYDAAG